jgi:hypothetical protein
MFPHEKTFQDDGSCVVTGKANAVTGLTFGMDPLKSPHGSLINHLSTKMECP